MAWDDDIEGPAYEIAASDDRRLRVLAGPGTGKTFALRHLVMRLLEQNHDPRRILVATFTRTAARDLQSELANLGVPGCEEINAATLHSFCFGVLVRSQALLAAGRVARPLIAVRKMGILGFEFAPLLADLEQNGMFGNKRSRIRRIRAYEAAWATGQHDDPGRITDPLDLQFEAELVGWLRFYEAMLIGELVPMALEYFEMHPAAVELAAYDHVIVDEYQDLNKAEQVIIDYLADQGRLLVVGDENQSIYSFRFANPDGIVDFSNRHPETVDKTLEVCQRCPENVVTAANWLIARNHPPDGGRQMRPLKPPGEIHRVEWTSLAAEQTGLSAFIQHLVVAGRYTPGDIMVLCPRRKIGTAIQARLVAAGIEAHSYFHEEILTERDAQEAFALLTLLNDTDDRVALRFWLGSRSTSTLSTQCARLRVHCEQTGDSPRNALSKIVAGELPRTNYAGIAARFEQLTASLAPLEQLSGLALIDALFPPDAEWAGPLRDVIAASPLDDLTLPNELLEYLRRYVTQPDVPSHPNFVRIMSIHASKGLTSRVVIVSTVIDSLIPTYNRDDKTDDDRAATLAEQRRLFYVAVTRAQEVLVLSYPAQIAPGIAASLGAKVRAYGRINPSEFLRNLNISGRAVRGAVWAERGYTP
jgi:DNA helicase-2/ATP-dependent DNA helicase PcrA